MCYEAINWVQTVTGVSSSAKNVLFVLANCADSIGWEAFPSIRTIISRSSLERKTVIRTLQKLQLLGLIVDTGKRKGSTQRVKVYRLNPNRAVMTTVPKTEPFPISELTDPNPPSNSSEFPTKQCQNWDAELSSNLHEPINNQNDENEFNQFWAAYPRKMNKSTARTAYDKAVKEGAIPSGLGSAAKSYADSVASCDPKYVKMPANWLKGRCWQDYEVEGAVAVNADKITLAPQIVTKLKSAGIANDTAHLWFNGAIFDADNNQFLFTTAFMRDWVAREWGDKLRRVFGDDLQFGIIEEKRELPT